MADRHVKPKDAKPKAGKRALDFVPHGSDRHASMLGLRKAGATDAIVHEGWTLADLTQYGPAARVEFLEATLKQKVNELTTPPQVPQSKDPRQPNYAPPMFVPPADREAIEA